MESNRQSKLNELRRHISKLVREELELEMYNNPNDAKNTGKKRSQALDLTKKEGSMAKFIMDNYTNTIKPMIARDMTVENYKKYHPIVSKAYSIWDRNHNSTESFNTLIDSFETLKYFNENLKDISMSNEKWYQMVDRIIMRYLHVPSISSNVSYKKNRVSTEEYNNLVIADRVKKLHTEIESHILEWAHSGAGEGKGSIPLGENEQQSGVTSDAQKIVKSIQNNTQLAQEVQKANQDALSKDPNVASEALGALAMMMLTGKSQGYGR